MLIMFTFQKVNILDQKLISKTIFHNLIFLPHMTYETHKFEKMLRKGMRKIGFSLNSLLLHFQKKEFMMASILVIERKVKIEYETMMLLVLYFPK